jgi:hypothetical protein
VHCADDKIRQCFPILAPLCIDYEEVCLATGIKNGSQCGICEVPFHEMQHISKQWPLRTPERMQIQIQKQETEVIIRADPSWVHPINSFSWGHVYSNIHENLAVDMLHQLQKGVFRNLVDMTKLLLVQLYQPIKASKANPKNLRKLQDTPGLVQLDERLANVPVYQGLKHFNKFSHVTQWTGGEERDLIRVWIPVITPLLIGKADGALSYTRALVDFITIAQYRTHNEETLRYLEHAVYRIDSYKSTFDQFRPHINDEAHHNYPKFHALSHYVTQTRKWGAPNGYDTEHFEAPHKFLLKFFYNRTNKNDDYLSQIASHNTRDTFLKAMEHQLFHFLGTTSQAGIPIPAQVTGFIKTAVPITEIHPASRLSNNNRLLLRHLDLKSKTTTTAGYIADTIKLPGFIEALATFVRLERQRKLGQPRVIDPQHLCEKDSLWVRDYPIQLFSSVRCWRRTGKDETDSEAQEPELLRCSSQWRGKGPRKDFCWVQAFPPTPVGKLTDRCKNTIAYNPLNGQRVGQLQVLISVVDIDYPTSKNTTSTHLTYHGALVDIFPLKGESIDPKHWGQTLGNPHPIHGMIEVTRPLVPTTMQPQMLKGRWFYTLDGILRSAHIVPSTNGAPDKRGDSFYINNYIDWDQYQVLYKGDWEAQGIRCAREFNKEN